MEKPCLILQNRQEALVGFLKQLRLYRIQTWGKNHGDHRLFWTPLSQFRTYLKTIDFHSESRQRKILDTFYVVIHQKGEGLGWNAFLISDYLKTIDFHSEEPRN